MPRDSSGNYALPAGNPVITGDVISSTWANPTLSDVAAELTNSLDRNGRGGMLAPFKFLDGSANAPGITWTTEPNTGFFRAGAADMQATIGGVPRMRWTGTGVQIWDPTIPGWATLVSDSGVGYAQVGVTNRFTQPQIVQGTSAALSLYKDAVPNFAGRLSYNVASSNALALETYESSVWTPRLVFTSSIITGVADVTTFGSDVYQRVNGTAKALGASAASGHAAGAEVGAHHAGTNNGRAALFSAGTNLGVDYTYSTGVSEFQFRRAGAKVLGYDHRHLRLYSYPTNTGVTLYAMDDSGGSHWIDTPNSHELRVNGTRALLLSASVVQAGNGRTFRLPDAGGTNWLDMQLASSSLTHALPSGHAYIWSVNSSQRMRLNSTGLTLFDGQQLQLNKVGNSTASALVYNEDSGAAPQVQFVGRGGVLHHDSSSLLSGKVVVGTGDPPAGLANGTIYLKYT